MNDQLFLLYQQRDTHYIINVYDRANLSEVKEVIPLPGTDPQDMAGCNVSNCVYISLKRGDSYYHEVLRISRDAEHNVFNISPWRNDNRRRICKMSVSDNGNLIFLSSLDSGRYAVGVYSADGILQREVTLPPHITEMCENINHKSNGNFVMAYFDIDDCRLKLLELDSSGGIVHQFQLSIALGNLREFWVNLTDHNYGTIVASSLEELQLIDPEFNLLGVYSLPQTQNQRLTFIQSHYDRKRNEMMLIQNSEATVGHPIVLSYLTIFRFMEQ